MEAIMIATEQEKRTETAAAKPKKELVIDIPPPRPSAHDDDLEPYNLPFTD
jgi:hypothetical protein